MTRPLHPPLSDRTHVTLVRFGRLPPGAKATPNPKVPLTEASQELVDYARDLDLAPDEVKAVESFGLRHSHALHSANRLLAEFRSRRDFERPPLSRAFEQMVVDVRRNRVVIPEVLGPAREVARRRRRRKKKFNLEE